MWDVCHIRWTELQKVKYIMQERHSYRVWCILNGWSVAEWYQKLSRLRNFNSALQDWILHITEFWVVLNDVVKCWAFKKNEFSSCGFAPNCYSYPTVNMHCVPCDAIQPNFLNKPPAFVIQYLGNSFSSGRTSLPYFTSMLQWISCSVSVWGHWIQMVPLAAFKHASCLGGGCYREA